jgi:hypothetical protein
VHSLWITSLFSLPLLLERIWSFVCGREKVVVGGKRREVLYFLCSLSHYDCSMLKSHVTMNLDQLNMVSMYSTSITL